MTSRIHLFYINSYTFISYLWIIFYKMSNCDLSAHLLSLEQTQMSHAFALNTSNTSQIYPIIAIYLWFEKWKKKEKREKREHSTTFDIRVAFSPDSVEPLWFAFIAFTRSVISMTSVNKIFCRCVFRTMSNIYDGDFPLKSHSLAGIYLLKVNNRFNTLFWFFFCWIWASKCRLGNWFRNKTP